MVWTPLKNMKVKWDDHSQYIGKWKMFTRKSLPKFMEISFKELSWDLHTTYKLCACTIMNMTRIQRLRCTLKLGYFTNLQTHCEQWNICSVKNQPLYIPHWPLYIYIYNTYIYIHTHQTIINLSNSISRVMSHLLVNMVNMILVSCYAATDGVCLPSGND